MKVLFSKSFIKRYEKMPQKLQRQVKRRVALLVDDSRHRTLNLHTVYYRGDAFISMNVTGDCRALFLWESEDRVRFYRVGTHSQLYG